MYEEAGTRTGYRKVWIMTFLLVLYIVAFWTFNYLFTASLRPLFWDMGGTPYVPAAALPADGYFERYDKGFGVVPPWQRPSREVP